MDEIVCGTVECWRNRHLRIKGRIISGFWPCHLSCFWYVYHPNSMSRSLINRGYFLGPVPALQSSIPLIFLSIRTDLHVVQTSSINADISLWLVHDNRTLSSHCPSRFLLAIKWDLESRSRRPHGLRCWPCRVVYEGRLDERDGWWIHNTE